jgi:hypothetical protein
VNFKPVLIFIVDDPIVTVNFKTVLIFIVDDPIVTVNFKPVLIFIVDKRKRLDLKRIKSLLERKVRPSFFLV